MQAIFDNATIVRSLQLFICCFYSTLAAGYPQPIGYNSLICRGSTVAG